MISEKAKCIKFLQKNGWEYDPTFYGGTGFYIKDGVVAVDLNLSNEIVFLDDTGDILHLNMCYYTLVGALLELRQLPINYLSWK